jgi:uncharacterized protein involved in exopolysaccharide biosynthesis
MELKLTARNVAHVVCGRWRTTLGFLIACLALNLVYLLITPAKYESDAQVMVKINFSNPDLARPEFGANPNNPGGPGTAAPQISDDLLKSLIVSYKALATSHDVELATVNDVTIDRLYPNLGDSWMLRWFFSGTMLDKAVEKLDDDIDVQQLKESNILQLSVFNKSPLVACQTLQTLLSKFFTMQQSVVRAPSSAFLGQQLQVARERVQTEDEALRQFKLAHQLSSIPDERIQLLTQRTDIADNLDTARSTLGGALARKQALQQSLREFEEHATASSGTDAMSRQLDDAQARLTAQIERYDAARTTYPADSPFVQNAEVAVQDARKRLSEIQREIDGTVRGGASPVYQTLQTDMLRNSADVSGAQAQVSAINGDLATINTRLMELDRLEGQLRQLESRVQVAQDNLTTQLQRSEESRISADLNKSQITSLAIVQQPTLPYKLARPRWKLSTALALLLGLFGGLALSFAREALGETFSLPEQVEAALDVPLLATVNLLNPRSA